MSYEITATILLVVLLFLSAFFSGSETALITLNRAKVRRLVDKELRGAKALQKLLSEPAKMLSTILICNNFVNVAASSIATFLAMEYSQKYGIGIATGVMTLLILTFGEITPKTIAIRHAERISLLAAKPISALSYILYPIIAAINTAINPIISLIGGSDKKNPLVTEEEIKALVDVGEEEGIFEEEEREMIHRVFELSDTIVKELMTARPDMVCLEVNQDIDKSLELITKHGYSRIPVYEEKIDNIIGVIYAKDILKYFGKKEDLSIKKIMREAYFVPETKSVDDLFKEFQKGKMHIALVVDEYGLTSGLITIEDIIEEIFGSIFDEYDAGEEEIKAIGEGTFIVNGATNIDDLSQVIDCEFPEGDFDTAGGFVFDLFERVPKQGEKIRFKNFEVSVEKIEKRRIKKIKLKNLGDEFKDHAVESK